MANAFGNEMSHDQEQCSCNRTPLPRERLRVRGRIYDTSEERKAEALCRWTRSAVCGTDRRTSPGKQANEMGNCWAQGY